MVNRIAVVILTMTLASCALFPQKQWYKPGASYNDFTNDRYACMQESKAPVSGTYVNRYGGASSSSVEVNNNMFSACMQARGYYLRVPQ
jgi:hypothetical protein